MRRSYEEVLQDVFDSYSLIRNVVEMIRKEAGLKCPICFLDYNTRANYPVMACTNQHTFCKACIDQLNPANPYLAVGPNNRRTLIPCPQCKTSFAKQEVKRNRLMELLNGQIISKIAQVFQDDIQRRKTITLKIFSCQVSQLKRQINALKTDLAFYKGLPELNTLNSLAIKQLSQQNVQLKSQICSLKDELNKKIYLLSTQPTQKKIPQEAVPDLRNVSYILTEKEIQAKIEQIEIYQRTDNNQSRKVKSYRFFLYQPPQAIKCIKYIQVTLISHIETLQTLQLKNIQMGTKEFLILLNIEFKTLKKLVLSHNSIHFSKTRYYLRNIRFLQELDLSFNKTCYLPANLYQLSGLKILNLQGVDLQQLGAINELQNLEYLSLKKKNIYQHDLSKYRDLLQSSSLQQGNIEKQFASNQLTELQLSSVIVNNMDLSNLIKLKKLSIVNWLKDQKITKILQNNQLEQLHLEDCCFDDNFCISINFNLMTSLTLKNSRIQKFNLNHQTVSSLKKVTIIQPQLLQFPKQLLQGGQIQFFHLQSPNVQNFPFELKLSKNLKVVKISIKEISVYPQFFQQFQFLQELDLKKLFLFYKVDEFKDYFMSSEIPKFSNLRQISLTSSIRMEIDISNLLQALNSNVRKCYVKRFELQNFIISSQMLEQILKLRQVQKMALINGLINTLPDKIQKLRNLTSLKLTNNLLKVLPASLFNLKNIQCLDLKGNPIKRIPQKIMQLEKLLQLVMDFEQQQFNYEKDIRLAFQLQERKIKNGVPYIQKFNIDSFIRNNGQACSSAESIEAQDQNQEIKQEKSACQDKKLHAKNILPEYQVFRQLSFYNLTQLTLASINLTIADLSLQSLQLQQVRYLNLSRNRLKFSKGQRFFDFLPSLENLDLSFNEISQIPQDFIQLRNITNINISHNHLILIPEYLYDTQAELQCLDLSYNQIIGVQRQMHDFYIETYRQGWSYGANLELNLQGNKLTETPQFFFDQRSIYEINISFNHCNYKLNNMYNQCWNKNGLNIFKANGINFQTFPVQLFSMPDIEQIHIDTLSYQADPSLIYIPPSKYLRLLSLQGYNFKQIPEGINKLQNLQTLNLSKNNLQGIDQTISSLLCLKRLQLRFNHISYGFVNLTKLSNLSLLDVGFNEIPISELPNQTQRQAIASLKNRGVIVIPYFDEELAAESPKRIINYNQSQIKEESGQK